MAIIDVRMRSVVDGKGDEARDFLKKIVQYHTSHGLKSRVAFPINGPNTAQLVIETEYESLAAMENHLYAFMNSDEWKNSLSKEMYECLKPGGSRHQYRIIE